LSLIVRSEKSLARTKKYLNQSSAKWLFFILLLFWGALSTVQILQGGIGPDGGNDLYTYWYAGLHIRQGTDPYQAFLQGTHPQLPIQFIDGIATEISQIVQPALQPAPGLTYPLILLLTPFAFFSFKIAKIAWFSMLLICNLVIPWLLLRALQRKDLLKPYHYFWLVFIFLGFSSTRYATISGQPSILVIVMMLLAWILARDRPIAAGLLLGFALSKYSLALGFWIYFAVVEIRPRLSLTALGVQTLGLFALARLGEGTVFKAIDGYIQLFLHHAPMEGIQLTSLLPAIDAYSPPIAIGLSIAVGVPLIFALTRSRIRRQSLETQPLTRLTLLTTLTFWSLLVAYHRAYDLQVFVIALGLPLLLRNAQSSDVGDRVVRIAILYSLISVILLSLPAGSLVRAWLPPTLGPLWIKIILRGTTWVVLIGVGLSIRLLFTLLPAYARDG
jgi:hypothetical protein